MPERISIGRAVERPTRYRFQVWQDGMIVASGSGTDPAAVRREANHYAMMYGQGGPVKVRLFGFRRTDADAGTQHPITDDPLRGRGQKGEITGDG